MQELVDQLLGYLRATWRYRWYAILVAWLIASAGWTVVDMLPDRYYAWTRAYVDTQTVLKPLLSGLAVEPNIDQIISMLSRTLISRPNLEKMIKIAGLDTNLKSEEDRAQLVSRLRKGISIKSAGKENVYTLTFVGSSPQEAYRVVESLLKLFVQESYEDKRRDSESARRFIDEQLVGYGEKLKAAEEAVMEFKRQNVGLMPSEGQGYYSRLRDAEFALTQAEGDLREAVNSRDAIKRELAGYKDATQGLNPELDARINALEKKLDNLLVTYTSQHPDVVALERLILHLKQQREAEAKGMAVPPGGTRLRDPGEQQLMVSLATAEAKVAAMRARVTERNRRYNELKTVADELPKVEAKFIQLTRDYEGIKTRYSKLLERRESAKISGDMQEDSGMTAFRVIDPPQAQTQPTWPDRPRLVTVILLAALGGGVGVAFLISQLRPTFDSARRLQDATGLPVLSTVIKEWTGAQKFHRTLGLVTFIVSFVSLLAAYAAIIMPLVLTA
jgi:polysaccharide chain length determinant protein (PEP-CTERM system associated)